MEFTDALKIMQVKKECVHKEAFLLCDTDCDNCKDGFKTADMIEAYQMAIFALKQLIESEGEKQTNADRFRAMTDEKLAELLCGYQCNTCDFNGFCDETDKCEEEIIEWLKQESDGE